MKTNKLTEELLNLVELGHHECIIQLVKKGASPNGVKNNQSILMKTVGFPYFSIAKELLDLGADVNLVTKSGTALIQAAAGRHDQRCDMLRLLIERGADVNAVDQYKRSALHYAAYNPEPGGMKLLLEHGAKPDILSTQKETALSTALSFGYWETAKLLLEYGASPTPLEADALAPFLMAASISKDDPSGIEMLASYGPPPASHPESLNMGLINACLNKNTAIVSRLLEFDADVNVCDRWGRSPLVEAIKKGADEIITLLLQKGALPDKRRQSGETPLHIAPASGAAGCGTVRLLLEAGAAPDSPDKQGRTPLDIAIANGRPDLAELIMDFCQNKNTDSGSETPKGKAYSQGTDELQRSKLAYAQLLKHAQTGLPKETAGLLAQNVVFPDHVLMEAFFKAFLADKPAICKLLLEHGLSPDYLREGQTMLSTAVVGAPCKLEIVEMLVDAGASPGTFDSYRTTPFHWLCGKADDYQAGYDRPYFYSKEALNTIHGLLEKMLKRGADVNHGDQYSTPLISAIKWRPLKTVRLLLDNGADVDTPTTDGTTPLMKAAELNDSTALQKVKLLLRRKAGISLKNKNGEGALAFASRASNAKISAYLLEKMTTSEKQCPVTGTDVVAAVAKSTLEDFKQLYQKAKQSAPSHGVGTPPRGEGTPPRGEGAPSHGVESPPHGEGAPPHGVGSPSHEPGTPPRGDGIPSHQEQTKLELTDHEGNTPLMAAAHCNRIDIAIYLTEKGVKMNTRNKKGFSALDTAILQGGRGVIPILLDNGADPEQTDHYGRTPLFHAAAKFDPAAVELLLNMGCNINRKSDFNHTVLMAAVDGATNLYDTDKIEIGLKKLLQKGAEVNARNLDDESALMLAAGIRNNSAYTAETAGIQTIIRTLLEAGAETAFSNKKGKTALHAAAYHNYIQSVKYLIKKGADVSSTDCFDKTPADYARQFSYKELIDTFNNL